MKKSTSRLLASPWTGALFALLAAWIIVPQPAWAGCSAHYVASRSLGARSLSELAAVEVAGAFQLPIERMPLPGRPPCSGAACSGDSGMPSIPLSLVSGPGGEQWAIASLTVDLNSGRSNRCSPEEGKLEPQNEVGSVFHPPRFTGVLPAF